MKETILIVDDEPHIRRILQFLLDQNGYEALAAASGHEALECAREKIPDLILLDLMMPHMDGFEVCQHLRTDYRTSQIPVIMVTAKGEVTDKVRGLEGGANDYLTKPYDNKELMARVRITLDWSRAQRQANPLTGLPGNRAIEAAIQKRIENVRPFSFLYLDIDNFKAFNDHYGYTRGDEAIKFVADVLRDSVARVREGSFIGHIGGDDFCAITDHDCGEELANAIVRQFEDEMHCLIEQTDLSRGHFEVRGRQGAQENVPFPSLTIAVVRDPGNKFEHWAKVSDAAAELKTFGKSQQGSIVVKERRTRDSGPVEPVASTLNPPKD